MSVNIDSIRQVPQNYPILWIKTSMKIGERNYALFLAVGLFSLFMGFGVGMIPFIGYVLASLLGFVVLLGELRLYKKILNKEQVNFETFMNLVFDPLVLRKLQPYLIIVSVVALLETLLLHSGLKFMNLTLIIPTLFMTVFGFAAFSEIDNEVLNPTEAIKQILKGFWQNIIACIVAVILVIAFTLVCALACLIPALLYALPMLLSVKYLVYASIFENMDIDQALAEWSALNAKPAVTVEPPTL